MGWQGIPGFDNSIAEKVFGSIKTEFVCPEFVVVASGCCYSTSNDLQELPYITSCLYESLRLYGIPEIEREMERDVVIDGKVVPAGCAVMINLFNLHRNPDVWENPSKFDPSRFSLENRKQELDPYAFIPFAIGPRNCIAKAFGMLELRLVLAHTLKRFTFAVKENHIPCKTMAITLKSTNGILLKVAERE